MDFVPGILCYNPAAFKKAHFAWDGQQASLSGFVSPLNSFRSAPVDELNCALENGTS